MRANTVLSLAPTGSLLLGALALAAGCSSADAPGLSDTRGRDGGQDSPNHNNGNNNNGGQSYAGADAGVGADAGGAPGNTNVSLGGAQDFGYFRRLLEDDIVPRPEHVDAAGFFAEHHTPLPEPSCGNRICLQAMLGVMGNLLNGENCTLLQLGLNSPIVADPSVRPPLSLAVVVDVSGSMQADGKIDFVRAGLEQMLNELADGDRVALVAYSDAARLLHPMAEVRGNRNELMEIARGLVANGATNLWAGLEMGYEEALSTYDSGRQNRVILLSDGQPTAGEVSPERILSLSAAYNSEGIGITSIGLGTDFNLELMRGLAEQADGNFYFVENAAAVQEVFTEELAYFTVPVAFDVSLRMEAGRDYELRRAYGSSRFEVSGEIGSLEVPSVFLAHRVAHDDVTEGGGRRGGGSALLVELMPRPADTSSSEGTEVATLDLSFREPGTDRIVQDHIVVRYPHAPWETLAAGYFENAIVTKSFVMLNILVALELSVDLFHSRLGSEAVAVLRRLVAAVRDYNDGLNGGAGDVDMDYDLVLVERLIEVMIANGAEDPENPPIPDDPWPAD